LDHLRAILFVAVAGFLGVAAAARAAEPPLIPRAVLFGNPERAKPLISPDGTRVAFLAPVKGVLNVWVGPVGAIAAARPVTAEKVRPVGMFQWARSGDRILYLQDSGGNEDFHLFAADIATGKTVNLTNRKKTRAEIVADSDLYPREILVGLNDRDPKWHDIWRIDVTTGAAALVERNEGFASFVADGALALRLAIKPTAEGGAAVFKRDGTKWVPFFEIPPDDYLTTYPVGISADSRSLYMLDSRGRDRAALVAKDIQSGAEALIGESAVADVASVIADPGTKAILAFSAEYERPEWTAVSSAVKPDLDALKAAVPGVWSLVSQSRDNRIWTVRIDNVSEPVKFAAYDRTARALTPLFTARPALEGAPLAPMHPHIVKARDGLSLVSYLTLPPGSDRDGDGNPEKPVPLVLNVHGGPWDRDGFGYHPEHQWLANRGYGVLSVNFRGSTGFGKTFVNAADREWAGKMHDDLVDAVRWSVARKIAQPGKIAIYGGSYGGYAALVGVTFTPETFACGVSIVGPSNLNTLLASIPPYWTAFLDTFKRRVGDPGTEEGRRLLTARSPLFKAERIVRPLLIAQGANDPRVKQAESDQIVDAMKARAIPVTYVLYADEGHGFARPENRLSFYAVSEAFLAKCLGGRFQPIGADFKGSSIAVPVGREHVQFLRDALEAAQP
jgi:dipeptidyl aminopeptidase/acylaminoacyl peptidase